MSKYTISGPSSLSYHPQKGGKQKLGGEAKKYILNLANTEGLSWVCWPQARKLNPL